MICPIGVIGAESWKNMLKSLENKKTRLQKQAI